MKNRSQHIRDHLKKIRCDPHNRSCPNSKDGPSQVVKDLKKKGIEVTIHHVGMVKLALRKKSLQKRVMIPKNEEDFSNLQIAKKLLSFFDNDLDLAKYNLEMVSKLLD